MGTLEDIQEFWEDQFKPLLGHNSALFWTVLVGQFRSAAGSFLGEVNGVIDTLPPSMWGCPCFPGCIQVHLPGMLKLSHEEQVTKGPRAALTQCLLCSCCVCSRSWAMPSLWSGSWQPPVSPACPSCSSRLQIHNCWCTNCLSYFLVHVMIRPPSAGAVGAFGVPLCDVVCLVFTWVSWCFSSEQILWMEPGKGRGRTRGHLCCFLCSGFRQSGTAVPAGVMVYVCWSLFVRLVQPTVHSKGKTLPRCSFLHACCLILLVRIQRKQSVWIIVYR